MTDAAGIRPMLPADTFQGMTLVITGGGTGLGKAVARGLLQLGACVVICGRRAKILEQTRDELQAETGGQVLAQACDVRQTDQVDELLAASLRRFGSVHGLVNNAAGNFICPTERLSYRAFQTIVDIVLGGSTHCTLAFGKHWIASGTGGVVLSMLATYAWTGSGYVVPSAVAKAGVLALTRSLASEWGKYGLRLNAIAPGPFPTEGAWSRLIPPEVEPLMDPRTRNPLGRVGRHAELVNLASYLLSPFSGYMTGECVVLDGGEWLRGAGQFNSLEQLSPATWDAIQARLRPRTGAS